jgi:hypothetical protein
MKILSTYSEAEPLEFYPKYDLKLTYKDGRKILIYANGDVINIEGHTFTLKRDISTAFRITTF